MRKFLFNKLIRDKLLDVMKNNNTRVTLKKAENAEEIISFLKEKIQEEANEVSVARDDDNLVEELADVLEVIHGFTSVLGIDFSEVEKKRVEKKEKQGGFEGVSYVKHVEVENGHKAIEYYLTYPNKYPEVEYS